MRSIVCSRDWFHLTVLAAWIGCGCTGSARGPVATEARAEPRLHAHPGSCRDCHGAYPGPAPERAPPKDVCSKAGCHPSIAQAEFVHGPVNLGECTLCHHPHAAIPEPLLVRPERELCRSCHDQLRTCPAAHERVAACSPCHTAHGGDNRYFLRKGPTEGAATARIHSPAGMTSSRASLSELLGGHEGAAARHAVQPFSPRR